MSGANEFDDKASRLLNRLTSQPAARGEGRREVSAPTLQELGRRWEEFEQSEEESRSKMGELTQNLSKLEESLREENEGRKRMDETFTQAAGRLESNMKKVFATMQKNMADREKKLQERIDALLRGERRQMEGSLREGDDILEKMRRLEAKVEAIGEQVIELRRARLKAQQQVLEHFSKQIRQMRGIFERDVHNREQKESRAMEALKQLYRSTTERMRQEDMERQESEQVLMGVVERLVDHIVEC